MNFIDFPEQDPTGQSVAKPNPSSIETYNQIKLNYIALINDDWIQFNPLSEFRVMFNIKIDMPDNKHDMIIVKDMKCTYYG